VTAFIESEAELRKYIPAPSKMIDAKRLPALEEHAGRFVSLCGFAAFATRCADGTIDLAIRVGAGRCVRQLDARTLIVSDDQQQGIGTLGRNVKATGGVGAIFAIPGVRETLRVNGRGRLASDAERSTAFDDPPHTAVVLELDEHYLHCAKAFIRSKLWEEPTPTAKASVSDAVGKLGSQERRFLSRSPFALLGTCSTDGQADISPRGDPVGFIQPVGDTAVLVPERPGNRLIDSLRNIVSQPEIAITCLVPGEPRVLQLRGRARLTADKTLLAPMSVRGKAPSVGIYLDLAEIRFDDAPAFAKAGLWDPTTYVDRKTLPTFGRMLVDQMDPNGRMKALKSAGLEVVLKRDERKGLY